MFAQVLKYVYILCILQVKNMFRPPAPLSKNKKKTRSAVVVQLQ